MNQKDQYCSKRNKNRNAIYCMCLLMGVICQRCRAMKINSCGNQPPPKVAPIILSDHEDENSNETSNENEVFNERGDQEESAPETGITLSDPESEPDPEEKPLSTRSTNVPPLSSPSNNVRLFILSYVS